VTRRLLLALVAIALLATGCTKKEYDSERLQDIVDATTPNPFRFVYSVTEGGVSYRVQGLIEDDLRYKLQLLVDDRPALEQVVVDDAVAVRFYAPGLVEQFIDTEIQSSLDPDDRKTSIPGTDVLDALRAQRWVIDRSGAPSLLQVDQTQQDIGEGTESAGATHDPLFDARTALSYVRRVAQEQYFKKFDPDALELTYKKGEDPFPIPDPDSGVERYDSIIFPLPSSEEGAQGGSQAQLPGYAHFRKLAAYVQDGKVLAIREFTGLSDSQEETLFEYGERLLGDTASDEILEGFRQSYTQTPADKRKEFLLNALNVYRDNAGRDLLRFRTMEFQLQDLGDATITVALPTEEVIEANLSILVNMGRKPIKVETEGEGEGEGEGGDATATTVAGTATTVAP
jgi:hypothetical protein